MSAPRWTPTHWTAHKDPIPSAPERWCVYANEAPIGLRMPAECTGPHAEANARLIAAAPLLWKALRDAVHRCAMLRGDNPDSHKCPTCEDWRAALAKAVQP